MEQTGRAACYDCSENKPARCSCNTADQTTPEGQNIFGQETIDRSEKTAQQNKYPSVMGQRIFQKELKIRKDTKQLLTKERRYHAGQQDED